MSRQQGEDDRKAVTQVSLQPSQPQTEAGSASRSQSVRHHPEFALVVRGCSGVQPPAPRQNRRDDDCAPSPVSEEPSIETDEGHNDQTSKPDREKNHGCLLRKAMTSFFVPTSDAVQTDGGLLSPFSPHMRLLSAFREPLRFVDRGGNP